MNQATAVRESCALTATERRDEDVLVDICLSGDRFIIMEYTICPLIRYKMIAINDVY